MRGKGRCALIARLVAAVALLAAPCVPMCAQAVPTEAVPVSPTLIERALGIVPLQQRLQALRAAGEGSSSGAVDLRLTIMARVLKASFDVDSVLGRVDTEAAYMNEDSYALQVRSQKEAATLNLVTIAASGALGAAGSAMQLTRGLNHAGTALQAASGGTALILSGIALILSGIQLRGLTGGRRPVRSHYNMLAQLLDRAPNGESTYPASVLAYMDTPEAPGRPPLGQALVGAWYRLGRVQHTAKEPGASVESLTADRTTGRKMGAEELADREAMLHDLHAAVILMRLQLQKILVDSEDGPVSP